MMTPTTTAVDWHAWRQRWDVQQEGYIPDREERFNAMLDVVEALLPPDFTALDLACGPGAISERLLARFPRANAIAVDLDPLLLQMGHEGLGTVEGRLRWVDADLNDPVWVNHLDGQPLDAVLSTTALHWLPTDQLIRLYAQLGEVVRPGGVFLNGDHIRFAPHLPSYQQVAEKVRDRIRVDAFERRGIEDWQQWWAAVANEPAFETLLAERNRRFGWRDHKGASTGLEMHEAALRDAGFREVGVIWQRMDNRVLMAVR